MERQKSVICAIVKNERRFIREWVEHYLGIGFDKVYIYEDFGSGSHVDELTDYIKDKRVDVVNLDETHFVPHYKKGTRTQSELYSKFLRLCRNGEIDADWVGFFDVDEFMMFEEGWTLEMLEDDFADYGGVLLSWKLYGASGHLKRPDGGVVESYTVHMSDGFLLDGGKQWNVKSLVNVRKCDGKRHIHVFNGCRFTDNKTLNEGKLVFCKAWLNHYYTKSWEDYLNRIFARGNMQNNYRCLDKFFKCNPDMLPKKKEMVLAQRNRHAASTMWISRDMKIISGGNEARLRELRKKVFGV